MEDWSTSHLIEHAAQFADDGTLRTDSLTFRPRATVIATGTSPVVPPEWREALGDRLLTSDDFFELETLQGRIAVVGMGPVGLELGQALARLGIEVTGFDPSPNLGGLSHPYLQELARSTMRSEFRIVAATAEPELDRNGAVGMNWDDGRTEVDRVLVAMGRKPNLEGLGLHHLGIDTDADTPPRIDESCLNTPGTRIYLAGDVSGVRPLLHEAADEGRIASYNAVRDEDTAFARRAPLQITFKPQIASVGDSWKELEPRKTEIAVASSSFRNSGRSQLARTSAGVIRIYAEKTTARLVGVELFAQDAEHLAHLFAFALEQGANLGDLLKMPFYHPTHQEVVRNALRDALDKCAVKAVPIGLDQFRCNDTPVDTAASGE